jgi:hypothetical protein
MLVGSRVLPCGGGAQPNRPLRPPRTGHQNGKGGYLTSECQWKVL